MKIEEFTLSGDRAQSFIEALKAASGKANVAIEPEIIIQRLSDHFTDYQRKHEFKPGQIVQVKNGLEAMCGNSIAGMPCIVIEVLASPVIGDTHGPGQEYGASLDLRVGALAPSGAFAAQLYESALFEPWPTNGNQDTQP